MNLKHVTLTKHLFGTKKNIQERWKNQICISWTMFWGLGINKKANFEKFGITFWLFFLKGTYFRNFLKQLKISKMRNSQSFINKNHFLYVLTSYRFWSWKEKNECKKNLTTLKVPIKLWTTPRSKTLSFFVKKNIFSQFT